MGMSPVTRCSSEWHSPELASLTSTSPSEGPSSSTSSTLHGWFRPHSTAASSFIDRDLHILWPSAAGYPFAEDVQRTLTELQAQHLLVELADAGLGDLADERPAFRHPPPRHPSLQELAQLLDGHRP